MPPPFTSRRASRTPSAPRDGSMLANAIAMSAFSAANSTTLSLGTIGRPVSFSSTGNTTQPIFRERKYSASAGQSRATPADPKYFCACLSASVSSPVCSRWTWTSMATSASIFIGSSSVPTEHIAQHRRLLCDRFYRHERRDYAEKGEQDVRRDEGRVRTRPRDPARRAVRIHWTERRRQDHDNPDDDVDSLSGFRRAVGAGTQVGPGGERPHRVPAGRAR